MKGYKEIKFEELTENLYEMTAKDWFALSAGNENGFIDKNVLENSYPKRDFHQIYVGKIEKIYVKE